ADLWRVYKQDGELGPLSAREIREGLRNGTIDPFDLVSREGSKIRVDLVEVDEIFAVEDSAEDAPDEPMAQTLRETTTAFSEPLNTSIAYLHPNLTEPGPKPSSRAKAGDRLEAQKTRSRERDDGRVRGEKKFNLYDKKRGALGPLSANEIQALYF